MVDFLKRKKKKRTKKRRCKLASEGSRRSASVVPRLGIYMGSYICQGLRPVSVKVFLFLRMPESALDAALVPMHRFKCLGDNELATDLFNSRALRGGVVFLNGCAKTTGGMGESDLGPTSGQTLSGWFDFDDTASINWRAAYSAPSCSNMFSKKLGKSPPHHILCAPFK